MVKIPLGEVQLHNFKPGKILHAQEKRWRRVGRRVFHESWSRQAHSRAKGRILSTVLGQARGNTKGGKPDTGQLSEMEPSNPFVALRVDSIYMRFQFLLVMPCFFLYSFMYMQV